MIAEVPVIPLEATALITGIDIEVENVKLADEAIPFESPEITV